MLHARLPRLAPLAVAVACLLPAPASAQIGGFLKNKLKQKVKGDSAAQQPSKSAPGPVFDEYVLQLTPQSLDRLERAVAAEKAFRDSAKAAHARDRTEAQWDRCRMDVLRSPEALALSKNTPSDAAGFQQQQQQFEALNQKKCGDKPEAYDPKKDLKPAEVAAAKSVGMTPTQYAVMKERIGPFCASPGARVPGATKEMFYVYAADEISTLQPRCSKLTALLATVSGGGVAAAGGAAGPKFEGDVIEMTPDVLARLEKYYSLIDAQPAAPRKAPATREQKQAFNQCAQQYMMSPEGRAAMQNMAQSASAGGRAGNGQDMAVAMKSAIEKKCGPSPEEGGASGTTSRDAAARAAGLTTGQIAVMQERISPACSTINAEPGKPFSAGMQRLFTPVELKALTARCAKLGPLVDNHIGR